MQMTPQTSFNTTYPTRSYDSSYQGESGYTTGIEDNLMQDVSIMPQNFSTTSSSVAKLEYTNGNTTDQSYESQAWIQVTYYELSQKCDEFKGMLLLTEFSCRNSRVMIIPVRSKDWDNAWDCDNRFSFLGMIDCQ